MDELEDANGVSSIAYEMLGPPRLAKLLFEGAILSRLHGGDLGSAASLDPAETARAAEALVTGDADLRTRMLSIGLPVLLADGARVLRGGDVKVRPEEGEHGWQWAADNGWVDLRPANWERWRVRLGQILQRLDGLVDPDGGSRWDVEPWERARRIRPGALAAWIFRYEDGGERIKR
jgi:hypothetical protein